jgi:mannose-6-phosphate isomerase-like protein (cupin superfamily)
MPSAAVIHAGSAPFTRLEQAVLDLVPGDARRAATADAEEVLFVVSGRVTLRLTNSGARHELEPETGAYLPSRHDYELHNSGPRPARVIAVRIPDPDGPGGEPAVSRLRDQAAEAATTDREFRIVADPEHGGGLQSATHFVGYIPTKRAPEHFHTYDEVIYVLDGEGIFHAGDVHAPLGPGSSIRLPARTVHCLENTGSEMMRVVAVFRPAGSPAEAYYPDGTPAYAGSTQLSAS